MWRRSSGLPYHHLHITPVFLSQFTHAVIENFPAQSTIILQCLLMTLIVAYLRISSLKTLWATRDVFNNSYWQVKSNSSNTQRQRFILPLSRVMLGLSERVKCLYECQQCVRWDDARINSADIMYLCWKTCPVLAVHFHFWLWYSHLEKKHHYEMSTWRFSMSIINAIQYRVNGHFMKICHWHFFFLIW